MVAMVAETTTFVEQLFQSLECDGYLMGEDGKVAPAAPPPPAPATKNAPRSTDLPKVDKKLNEDSKSNNKEVHLYMGIVYYAYR